MHDLGEQEAWPFFLLTRLKIVGQLTWLYSLRTEAQEEVFALLATDARARLAVGQPAFVTYGPDPKRVGQTKPVTVLSLDEGTVCVAGKRRCLRKPRTRTLPRSVVLTRPEGTGPEGTDSRILKAALSGQASHRTRGKSKLSDKNHRSRHFRRILRSTRAASPMGKAAR